MNDVQPLESRRMFASVPSGFALKTVTDQLHRPTTMAFAPDGRLFVAQQDGALRVIRGGKLLDRPFKTFTVDSDGERGLLGIAFDPDYAVNHYVYVFYTVPASGDQPTHNRVSRLVANGDHAVSHSEQTVFDLSPLSSHTNHNGGTIRFGPDGKLYIATGDNARQPSAQELTNTHGKILRIFPDGRVPKDNPFAKAKHQYKAIWAIGLRNPFTFSFDPKSDRMYINDVGAETYEEINIGKAGSNYGWSATEGPFDAKKAANRHYTAPLFYYGHGVGATTGEAIVGSAFYSPAKSDFPSDYSGDYFFADLASGWIRKLDAKTNKVSGFATGITLPVNLAVSDADGGLYVLSRSDTDESGRVTRIGTV